MDLQFFLNILLRRKWLILTAVLLAAGTTYYFVDRQQEKFQATAVLSTGIVEITGLDLNKDNPWIQKFYVDMGFGNLIEFITSQRNVTFLTYRLLAHDLAPDSLNSEKPFRTIVNREDYNFDYSQEEVMAFRELLKEKLEALEYTLDDPKMERIYKDLSAAYGYDYESIMSNHLQVQRKGETDLINVQFMSEHPKLSSYSANTFCQDFLKNYQSVQQEGEVSSVRFLKEQLDFKKELVDSLRRELKLFKNQSQLSDLEGQREAVITQIKELENQRSEYRQKIPAIKQSLREVESYLAQINEVTSEDMSITLVNNKALLNMEKQWKTLMDEYIASGMKDEQLKRRADLIQKNMKDRSKRLASTMDPISSKNIKQRNEELFRQKVELRMELNEAENGIEGINLDLGRLRGKSNSFVSAEAYIKQLGQELSIAEGQYESLFVDYNKEKLQLDNSILPVKVFQHAQIPEKSVP